MTRNEAGNVATELALILPVFLLFIGGIIDFSCASLASHLLTDAARAGARKAAVSTDFSDVTPIISAIQDNVPNLGLLKLARIDNQDQLVPTDISGDTTDHLMVRVNLAAPFEFRFLRLIGLRQIEIKRTAIARYEWQTAGTSATVNFTTGESTNSGSSALFPL